MVKKGMEKCRKCRKPILDLAEGGSGGVFGICGSCLRLKMKAQAEEQDRIAPAKRDLQDSVSVTDSSPKCSGSEFTMPDIVFPTLVFPTIPLPSFPTIPTITLPIPTDPYEEPIDYRLFDSELWILRSDGSLRSAAQIKIASPIPWIPLSILGDGRSELGYSVLESGR